MSKQRKFKVNEFGQIVLTKEETIIEHRKMWLWIANEIKKNNYQKQVKKINYLIHGLGMDLYGSEIIINACFLCNYVDCKKKYIFCSECPLDWGNNKKVTDYMCIDKEAVNDGKGLYQEFINANKKNDYQKAEQIARDIANLKERA